MFRCVRSKAPALTRGLRGVPPELAHTLEQRLALLTRTDPELLARIDIGYVRKIHEKDLKALRKKKRNEVDALKRNNELRKLCLNGDYKIDLDRVKSVWTEDDFRADVLCSADHYNIFQDLFEFGYFRPVVHMRVAFPISEDEVSPVHYGNIISCADTARMPTVEYDADPNELYTLVMTSLDSYLEAAETQVAVLESGKLKVKSREPKREIYRPDRFWEKKRTEYLHWMVGNIPGNEISKGTTVCDYMRPFMPKGTGYHRFAFVLYRQEKSIDFSQHTRTPETTCLKERTFRTIDFYRSLEEDLTPCGLSFFQSDWDDCLMDFFHHDLGMKVPVFEHVAVTPVADKWKKFPENESFNHYIDNFRDPQEIAEDIYCRRLKKLDPFKDEVPPAKFPHAHPMNLKEPSWLRAEHTMERNLEGKFRHLKRFSLYPEGQKKQYKKVKVQIMDLADI